MGQEKTHLLDKLHVTGGSDTDKIREEALSRLRAVGFPTKRNEEYKYSPMSRHLDGFYPTEPSEASLKEVPDFGEGYYHVFINGVYASNEVSGPYQADCKHVDSDELKSSANSQDSFELLNTIASSEVLDIRIPRNTSVDKPIILVHAFTGSDQEVSQARVRIHAAAGSKASVVEMHISESSRSCYTNNMTQVEVEPNSNLTLTRIGNESDSVRVSNTRVEQHGDSSFSSINVDLKGQFIRNNLRIVQHGSNCETNMYGLYMAADQMHVDNHTSIDHQHPHSESNELYKGILNDQATAVFNGKIYVRKEAQKTNAFQQNNNILLSEEATINTKPQLEIWADDVKCSHGCTTGQLDQEQIFYLRSRGLGVTEATALLLEGFALEVLENIPDEHIREIAVKRVLEKLHG